MVAISATHTPLGSFAVAIKAAGDSNLDSALLADLQSSWFYVGEPRLTDLPDFFGPFFTAVAVACLKHPDRVLHVADFGGAIGRYRAYVDAMFSGAVNLRWTVIETPLYVDHGRATNQPNVAFESSFDDVRAQINFAFFSGVLQYLPDWKAVLGHAAVRNAKNIFITMTPLGAEERPFLQTVTYESGVVRMAARVIPQTDLFAHLGASHALFTSFALEQHHGVPMGIFAAPAMLWKKQGGP